MSKCRSSVWVAAVAMAITACGGGSPATEPDLMPDPISSTALVLEVVSTVLDQPVFLTAAPGDNSRMFVVERPGIIRIIRNGSVVETPFLDITNLTSLAGERGLLSFAFHPQYNQNGQFFVYYTDVGDGGTRVVRYNVSGDPDVADPSSARLILAVDQPFDNHNGGQVAFGPDGMLYIGLGDGGSGGDPLGNGQDLSTLLGNILRLDVDGGDPFAIPLDNPHVGDPNARDEIWAAGLRNPWRFSFDRETGDLYIADVGQDEVEEVDVQRAVSSGGENYGWNTMEGSRCFLSTNCDTSGLTLPVLEYLHNASGGCSVTGGYVYRGARIPELAGRYLYGDFCSEFVRSFLYDGSTATDRLDHSSELVPGGGISSFGEDANGEIYVLTIEGGVFRIAPVQ